MVVPKHLDLGRAAGGRTMTGMSRRRRRSAGQEFLATVRYIVVLLVVAWFMWNVVRPVAVATVPEFPTFSRSPSPAASPS